MIEQFCNKHHIVQFIRTSVDELKIGIAELKQNILRRIDWNKQDIVMSPQLWQSIQRFIETQQHQADPLVSQSDLYVQFSRTQPNIVCSITEFEHILSGFERQGLITKLGFGDQVLLLPELENDYAALVVHNARDDKLGKGSVRENRIYDLEDLDFGKVKRLPDPKDEERILRAVVQKLIQRQLVFRTNNSLVFPSKFNLDRPAAPAQPPLRVRFFFQGIAEAMYATLVVKLYYNDIFKIKNLYRNIAIFLTPASSECGFELQTILGNPVLCLFYEHRVSNDAQILLHRVVYQHILGFALPNSIRRERIYACPHCAYEMDQPFAVASRIQRGSQYMVCAVCDQSIPLLDPLELSYRNPETISVDVTQQAQNIQVQSQQRSSIEANKTLLDAKRKDQHFDIFLSFNNDDFEEVKQVVKTLEEEYGLSIWWAPRLRGGDAFWQEIVRQIHRIPIALFVVGQHNISNGQQLELDHAFNARNENNIKIVPVLLPSAPAQWERPPRPLDIFQWINLRQDTNVNLIKLAQLCDNKNPPNAANLMVHSR